MNPIFESEIAIRPDDIDLNNHVHNTKYLDYVLAVRFVQMISLKNGRPVIIPEEIIKKYSI